MNLIVFLILNLHCVMPNFLLFYFQKNIYQLSLIIGDDLMDDCDLDFCGTNCT